MHYDVVFDAAKQGFDWRFPAIGLGILAVGLAMWLGERSLIKRKNGKTSLFTRLFLGFAIFWASMAIGGTLSGYYAASRSLERGKYQTVEGVVENFDPMPAEGHKDESFTVRGHKFSYSDYRITPYFHNAASHGGPIRPGLPVRIHYQGQNILRLEIANDGPAAAPAQRPRMGPEPLLILLLFVGGWPTIMFLISILGGWRRLAQRYPAPASFDGETCLGQSIELSLFGRYANAVHITVGAEGFRLAMALPFRMFHPPWLIPWTEVRSCERRDRWFFKRMTILFGSPPGEEIKISGKCVLAIERAWKARQGSR